MPPLRWDIYQDLLSEAGFLWTQWTQAMAAPDYTLDEGGARDEARLLAALGGLLGREGPGRENGPVPVLKDESDTELMVAASWALLAADDRAAAAAEAELVGPLLAKVEKASNERQLALEWALMLGPAGRARDVVVRLLRSPDAFVQAL